MQLSDEEMELLFLVRTGNYEELTIKQHNGQIKLIEVTRTENPDQRITDILGKGKWQDIRAVTSQICSSWAETVS